LGKKVDGRCGFELVHPNDPINQINQMFEHITILASQHQYRKRRTFATLIFYFQAYRTRAVLTKKSAD
jgi:hypothetical protein